MKPKYYYLVLIACTPLSACHVKISYPYVFASHYYSRIIYYSLQFNKYSSEYIYIRKPANRRREGRE
ncbi:MAG: hypothetical protein M2R45_00772 [Verrucomicrobia subdivision 3 bacterium]|nr:hypothetical protein [Limisphaerales bacterium]MCS1413122.1 hypothetical protein [Limisphaerales bacterium]